MVQSKFDLMLGIIFAAMDIIKTNRVISKTVDNDLEFFAFSNTNYLNDLNRDTIETNTEFENYNETQIENITEFVQVVINRLIQFNDLKLQEFFTVINDEARKYHYRGCKFYELTLNLGFRRFLARIFTELKTQPSINTRNALKIAANKLKHETYDEKQKGLINMIKALYNKRSLKKFKIFLDNIQAYNNETIKNLTLATIVKKGLRSIIFDHYSQLNNNARMALKFALNDYWNHFNGFSTFESTKFLNLRKTTKIINKSNLKKNNSMGNIKPQDVGNNKSTYHPISLITLAFQVDKHLNRYHEISLLTPDYEEENKTPVSNKQTNNEHNIEITKTTYLQSHGRFINKGMDPNMNRSKYELNLRFSISPPQTENNLDAYEYLTSTRRKIKWIVHTTLYPEFEDKLRVHSAKGNTEKQSRIKNLTSVDEFDMFSIFRNRSKG